ncbi:MAG: type I restriction endonuclease [Azospirillaceae bacterium]
MSLTEKLRALAGRVEQHRDAILTEEATKNALVMPFLQALGYDVFNPAVVVPEFVADVGVKKGEKVDYALMNGGSVVAVVECKGFGSDLANEQFSQLYRYFAVTSARVGILTNGVQYWFYTDIDDRNKMDSLPFFRFDLNDIKNPHVQQLEKFKFDTFNLDNVLSTASFLKYSTLVQAEIIREMEEPSEEIVRFFASKVHKGRFTKGVRDQFEPIVAAAFREVVRDQVNHRLTSALEASSSRTGPDTVAEAPEPEPEIVTTEEEIEAYNIIRAVVREVIDVGRVHMRDAKSYCAILVDDNNRKPLARLHFNRKTKYVGLFDAGSEDRIGVECLEDLFGLADRLKATASTYAEA